MPQTISFLSLSTCPTHPAAPHLSLLPCPSPFKRSWPATSQGPQSQHLPPLPCCHGRCTPQTPPSLAAGRSQSPCPSSPAERGPLQQSHPDWWGLQSGSLVRCCCRERKERIKNREPEQITCVTAAEMWSLHQVNLIHQCDQPAKSTDGYKPSTLQGAELLSCALANSFVPRSDHSSAKTRESNANMNLEALQTVLDLI